MGIYDDDAARRARREAATAAIEALISEDGAASPAWRARADYRVKLRDAAAEALRDNITVRDVRAWFADHSAKNPGCYDDLAVVLPAGDISTLPPALKQSVAEWEQTFRPKKRDVYTPPPLTAAQRAAFAKMTPVEKLHFANARAEGRV